MNPRLTLATAARVLRQVRADHRILALLLVVPCVLIGILAWVYHGTPVFNAIGGPLLGTALGLFVSAFARTEFQAVQFMPAFVLPQLLLCGLLVAREAMPDVLHWISNVLPLSYAVDAMTKVSVDASATSGVLGDVGIVLAFAVGALLVGALTLRRRTP